MRAKRYCEVLLLHPNAAGFQADVFNSYPLNDCRQSRWKKLNAVTIAKRQRATLAVLNGPRYWLMDHIDKTQDANIVRARFGGIEMIQRATVQIKSVVEASKPFARNHVNRQTTFTFDGGATIYELTAADGTTFVMQSWSQQIDPILSEADLAKLATRIHPPAGWRYSVRTLETPLRVVTQASDAVVIQDDLKNSYSLETSK